MAPAQAGRSRRWAARPPDSPSVAEPSARNAAATSTSLPVPVVTRASSGRSWLHSTTGQGRRTSPTLAAVAETMLIVTQVAPYVDGPAGVHGTLPQAVTALSELADLAGLSPVPVS